MNKKVLVRIVALILAAVMLLGIFAGIVSAAETEGDSLSSYDSSAEFEAEDTEIIIGNSEHASVGIIGGADGPTAIFVSGNPGAVIAAVAVVIAAIVITVVIIKKRKK